MLLLPDGVSAVIVYNKFVGEEHEVLINLIPLLLGVFLWKLFTYFFAFFPECLIAACAISIAQSTICQ